MYDEFIKLPIGEEEWVQECKSFIKNYEFPCVGVWDGFHVNITTHLKNHYSFQSKYTESSLGLVEHNKRFLHLTTGVTGSTHDARLLRHCSLFRTICNGDGIPNKSVSLGNAGEIPLITTDDSAFPRLPLLIKAFNENTRDPKEKYFNKKLCSARVVTENAYGILKERSRLTYKKCECKLYNIRYVITTAAVLHNICIYRSDPWNPVGDSKLKILDSRDLRRNAGKDKIVRTKALKSHKK